MDMPSRMSRLEERTDNHGDAARDMRIKHTQMDIDIKSLEGDVNRMKGGLKVAVWFGGILGAAIMALVDFFMRWKH